MAKDRLDAILRPTPSAITTPPGPHRHTASTVRAAHAALRVPPEDVLPGRRRIAISVCPTPLGSVLKAAFDDLNDAVRRVTSLLQLLSSHIFQYRIAHTASA